jgi:hypothetical protein
MPNPQRNASVHVRLILQLIHEVYGIREGRIRSLQGRKDSKGAGCKPAAWRETEFPLRIHCSSCPPIRPLVNRSEGYWLEEAYTIDSLRN